MNNENLHDVGRRDGRKPNVVIILADDLGFSDIGCYGGHIETPNLDKLAANGIRFTQFYNTARCSPARASLLTGLHPHQAGMAHLQGRYGPHTQQLSDNSVTIPEVLKENGYGTYMSGKWHAGIVPPHQRGFDKAAVYPAVYFNPENITINGKNPDPGTFGDDYFSTDHITDTAIDFLTGHFNQSPDKPFFLYMPYTAPHFPLQAKEEDIQKYKGRFDQGWDVLREQKFKRMKDMGIIDRSWGLSSSSHSAVTAWEDEPHQDWRKRAMEVYAAMVDCMDQNIGRLVETIDKAGQLDNTLLIFLSDNGGNGEFPDIQDPEVLPGPAGYATGNGHYGYGWANLSNTPFRMYKHYIHEGGIASPFIVHWPTGLNERGTLRKSPAQLPDILATVVDVTGSRYPEEYKGNKILPMEGASMISIFERDTSGKQYLFWEHEGNCGVRYKNWKLVRFYDEPWELYDMEKDGTEVHDVSDSHQDLVQRLSEEYDKWTKRANVLTRKQYMEFDKEPNRKEQVVNIKKMKETMSLGERMK